LSDRPAGQSTGQLSNRRTGQQLNQPAGKLANWLADKRANQPTTPTSGLANLPPIMTHSPSSRGYESKQTTQHHIIVIITDIGIINII
jgi:hypothetical protein